MLNECPKCGRDLKICSDKCDKKFCWGIDCDYDQHRKND